MKCFYKHCNKDVPTGKVRRDRRFCSINCKNNHNVPIRRRRIKLQAIEYKGGKCLHCGYNKSVWALTFHHLDPTQKDFAIGGNGSTKSWERMKVELDKCILLCMNCHAEEHERLGIN